METITPAKITKLCARLARLEEQLCKDVTLLNRMEADAGYGTPAGWVGNAADQLSTSLRGVRSAQHYLAKIDY